MISILLRVGPALFATATCPMEVLHAAGIERIAVTDTQITVHPEAGTTGTLKVVSVEPYDDYQSSRGWKIGGTNDGGVINFDREGSALLTFTAPSGSFDPQIENTTSPIETSKVRHLTMRVKVDGFSGTIPAAAYVFGGGGVASANFNIPADGTWQFARLDLSTISGSTTWSGQRTLSIDLPESVSYATYQNAMISIDWIAVTDEADFSDPLRWSRWEKFWDLGYQPAITTADASSPIAFARYDGSIDRYYQKFHLVNGFTPVGNAHWVDDFSGLSYIEVTDHGFAQGGAGAGTGSVVNGVYRMTYSDPGGSPFEPQLATPNSEINGNQSRYLHARVRLLGYSGSDPTITATMLSTATGLSSVDASFVPNGAWQILHFDMQSGPDWGAHENIRLDLPNQAGANPDHYLGATLEVDWFAVNNSPTYDGTGPLAAYEFKYDFQIDRKLATTIPLKGRQGVDAFAPADFIALDSDVGKLNFTVNNLVSTGANPRVTWNVDGIGFGINPDQFDIIHHQVTQLGDLGINTYMVMLNQSNDTLVNDQNWPFINSRSSDQAPSNLYAFNTGDAYGLRYTRAVFEYIAQRMARPDTTAFDNWIYGNEVDAHWFWHNLGNISQADFRKYFAVEFRQAALVLAKYNPEYRVLLSHTHDWRSQAGINNQSMPSKTLIDGLNTIWTSEGNFAWDVAFHPYPKNLFVPTFWNDTQATYDFNTSKITYKNYEVLPEYFQQDALRFKGVQRNISLTEQGFHTPNNGADEDVQAAAYAYHWHRFKRIPGYKADIIHRYQDHPAEGGLLLGILRDLNGDPKLAYDVYDVADTANWRPTFDLYLPRLPFSSWDAIASVPAWTVLDLPFDEQNYTQGWQAVNNVSGFSTNASGNLVGTISGADPMIANNNFFALEHGSEKLLVRLKVDTGTRLDIFWGTQTSNVYAAQRNFTATTNADNNFHYYLIDTLDHVEWNDQMIRRIRFDPTEASTGTFELDYILTGKRGDFDADGVSDENEGISTMRDSNGDGVPDFADPDVAVAIPPDFDSWLAGFSILPGADTSPGGDADGDGLTNYEEYIFGMDPASATSTHPIITAPDNTSGTFTYTRRKPALTGLASYRIMVSEDLQSWTQDTTAHQSAMDVGDNQLVTVTLTSELLAAPRLFIRVAVP